MQAMQLLKVDVAKIHDVERTGFRHQNVEEIDLVPLAVADVNEAGDVATDPLVEPRHLPFCTILGNAGGAEALGKSGWNVTQAASLLGISGYPALSHRQAWACPKRLTRNFLGGGNTPVEGDFPHLACIGRPDFLGIFCLSF
jgi:hypothetical protein